MLEGSIGNFTSRVLATFTALPHALRLGMRWMCPLDPSPRLCPLDPSPRLRPLDPSPRLCPLDPSWAPMVVRGQLLAFTATRSIWPFLSAREFKVMAGIAWIFCAAE